MSTASRYWADWTTLEFSQAKAQGRFGQTIAILPVAATEQHGPHLPLKVDGAIVDGVVAASQRFIDASIPALFLPTQHVGFSPEHMAFDGTLTLKAETLIHLWTDIGESVARSGIKKLVLFNAHGGQVGLMDVVARDLRSRLGMLVYSVNWYSLPLRGPQGDDVNTLFDGHEHRFGIHAGDIETSTMLSLAPDLVDMTLAQNFLSTSEDRAKHFKILGDGKSAKLGWQMQDYNAAGAVGNAAAATPEKGRTLIDAAGRALAELLSEVHRLPMTTLKDKHIQES